MADDDQLDAFAAHRPGDLADDKLVLEHLRLIARKVGAVDAAVKAMAANDKDQAEVLRDIRHQQALLFDELTRINARFDGIVDEQRLIRQHVDELRQHRVEHAERIAEIERWRDALPPPRLRVRRTKPTPAKKRARAGRK